MPESEDRLAAGDVRRGLKNSGFEQRRRESVRQVSPMIEPAALVDAIREGLRPTFGDGAFGREMHAPGEVTSTAAPKRRASPVLSLRKAGEAAASVHFGLAAIATARGHSRSQR
jgi:hypothetical protein